MRNHVGVGALIVSIAMTAACSRGDEGASRALPADQLVSSFAVRRVDGPAPLDLQLTLSPSPRAPAVYYGRSAETAADAATAWMLPAAD